ncbi:YdcF family protein [Loigolactobacillus binensis]|uniref:YdcF family protein n=1 Tax=Loigolactobacillus binensis TaxID=2559922 RepID=UPI0010FA1D04|nr:YdcF family protein [Loigolactobacillus binensis]
MKNGQKVSLMLVTAGIITLVTPLLAYPKAPRQQRQRADVIIVPGHPATNAGHETALLKTILDHAVKLYRQGLASYILVSGGAIHTSAIEADVMAQGLIARGIPRAAILRERHARHTGENFSLAQPLLVRRQLLRAIVVTCAWHMRKASFYAHKAGIQHTISVAPRPLQMSIIQAGVCFVLTDVKMLWQLPLAYHKQK